MGTQSDDGYPYTIQDYKKRIDNNPIHTEKNRCSTSDYRIYRNRLLEDIYCCLMLFDKKERKSNQTPYEDFSIEIIQQADKCIEKYDPSIRDSFWDYFHFCWVEKYKHLTGGQIVEQNYGGIHFSDSDERLLISFSAYYAKKDLNTEGKIKQFAADKNISKDKAEEIYSIYCDKVLYDISGNSDSEDEGLPGIFDKILQYDQSLASVISNEIRIEKMFSILDAIQKGYDNSKIDKRTGAAVITNIIGEFLADFIAEFPDTERRIIKYSFFDTIVFLRVRAADSNLAWGAIAELCEKQLPSVSRLKVTVIKDIFGNIHIDNA